MKILISTISLILISVTLLPLPALALGLGDAATQLEEAGEAAYGEDAETSLEAVVGTVINAALSIIGIVFLILTFYAGYLRLTASGSEEQVKKSNTIIKTSIIGIIIVVLAYGISAFVVGSLFGEPEGSIAEGEEPAP